jgi:hypothetical protein
MGYSFAMTTILEEPRSISVRNEWTQALTALEQELTVWAQAEGWQVQAFEKSLTEEVTGMYTAPDLTINTPDGGRLLVEVKGRGPINASGRVQISAWPTLFRVVLLHKPGADGWVIRTDSGIPLHQPWNRETFLTLANDLLNAEDE